MSIFVSCPLCLLPVEAKARTCTHCGVDLAMAAAAAEQAVSAALELPKGLPLAPEILVPRIGEYLIEKGILQPAELQRALDYQAEHSTHSQPILIGQALLALKLVDRETLDQAITMQILQLQAALSDTNRKLEQRVRERTQDLQKALDRLSELNQLKSNFIANISHELRTPLTHIKGYLDILTSEGLGPLTDQQREALAVTQRAEVRLERLIEDLIQFSLASRGELSLELGSTQIDRLVFIIVDRVKHRADSNSIKLTYKASSGLPRVKVDEDKIGWVILQLLDNALKFTPPGGAVHAEATQDEGLVTISISDTGIGIPGDRIGEIFEPFHQLDSSTTRRYAGTGLGLAMVSRILEAHGSQIKVQSVEGKGSQFTFSLPIETPAVDGNGKSL